MRKFFGHATKKIKKRLLAKVSKRIFRPSFAGIPPTDLKKKFLKSVDEDQREA